jgi:hypothetical protein
MQNEKIQREQQDQIMCEISIASYSFLLSLASCNKARVKIVRRTSTTASGLVRSECRITSIENPRICLEQTGTVIHNSIDENMRKILSTFLSVKQTEARMYIHIK